MTTLGYLTSRNISDKSFKALCSLKSKNLLQPHDYVVRNCHWHGSMSLKDTTDIWPAVKDWYDILWYVVLVEMPIAQTMDILDFIGWLVDYKISNLRHDSLGKLLCSYILPAGAIIALINKYPTYSVWETRAGHKVTEHSTWDQFQHAYNCMDRTTDWSVVPLTSDPDQVELLKLQAAMESIHE